MKTNEENNTKKESLVFWAGFSNGRISIAPFCSGDKEIMQVEVFKTKKDAKELYEDVRKVTIEEIP